MSNNTLNTAESMKNIQQKKTAEIPSSNILDNNILQENNINNGTTFNKNHNENLNIINEYTTVCNVPLVDNFNNAVQTSNPVNTSSEITPSFVDPNNILGIKKEEKCSVGQNWNLPVGDKLDINQSRLDFRIKYEGNDLPKRRKKICRKMYNAFMNEFHMEKADAKISTLNVEYRIHS